MARNAVLFCLSCLFCVAPVYAATSLFGYDAFIHWIVFEQVSLHRELATAVQKLSQDGSPLVLWSLVSASFLYGIFHAAGPGHGKAVISAYMLASRAPLRRGIGLSFLCAAVQGLMAVLLMVIVGQLFSLAGKAMQISRFFELASFAAVGLIGVWMFTRLVRGKSSCGHDHSHDHDHAQVSMKEEQAADRRSVFAMILAVGIRPCSGAVLVLLFSMSAGIFHWGILATLAMSLGTAITVAGLATVSVIIRDSSFLMGGKQSVWRQKLSRGFGFFAAIVLIIISISMIWSYSSNAGRVF
jgi:ABC-type nickel/cobalt efflux system permease component RcnA